MVNENGEQQLSVKAYLMDRMFTGSTGVAHAVFVTLGIGLLFETMGSMLNLPILTTLGGATKFIFAPAVGAGIAVALKANTLTIFSSMAAATLGAGAMTATEAGVLITTGEPIGAVMAGIVATFVGKKVTGKTPLDMMAVPILSILIGGLSGVFFYSITGPALVSVSGFITRSVENAPVLGSSVISLLWSILLMSPASSAALAVALQLDDTASAAALIGCTVQFVGFTIMSLKENDLGGFLAQSICTPKVQFPNVTKNIRLLIPPFIAAVIVAPIATAIFGFKATAAIGGLGLCSFIAPLYIINNQGTASFMTFVLVGGVLSGAITYIVYRILKKINWIKDGDLALKIE